MGGVGDGVTGVVFEPIKGVSDGAHKIAEGTRASYPSLAKDSAAADSGKPTAEVAADKTKAMFGSASSKADDVKQDVKENMPGSGGLNNTSLTNSSSTKDTDVKHCLQGAAGDLKDSTQDLAQQAKEKGMEAKEKMAEMTNGQRTDSKADDTRFL